MITIRIELWPLGDERRAREIGRMYIANDGQASVADPKRGDYVAAVCRRGTTAVPAELVALDRAPKATRSGMVSLGTEDGVEVVRLGQVEDYPRLTYNVWRLVTRALRACFPEEDRRKASAR